VDLPGQPSLTNRQHRIHAGNGDARSGDAGSGATSSISIDTRSIDLDTPSVALAIGAHPDDVEFGCGATLAKWAAAGCAIHHLVCTDGAKGTWDPKADTAELVARRRVEQREASRRLGGRGAVTFLSWPDGELEAGIPQRSEVAHAIRSIRPDVVLGHDPWRRYRLHPDHRNAGFLVCDAVVAARDPHFFPEQNLESHRPTTLLLWEADEPDHFESVDDAVETKLWALEAHESQFESTMGATTDADLEAFRAKVRHRLEEIGSAVGCRAAEAFKRITDL
jgi:LmbE family N-acetylglucosaminyl deacetylase